jgi:AcrR family transcriptional regulator
MAKALTEQEISSFREELCRVATQLFGEHGYEGVTMRTLAKQVGCSPMTPYRYFESKEEIFAVVRAAAFDRLADACEKATREVENFLQGASATSWAYLHFALKEPHAYRIMFELSQPDDAAYPELAEAVDRSRHFMYVPLETLVSEGILAGDPAVLANVFWAGIHGVIVLHLAGKIGDGVTVDQVFDAMLSTLSAGSKGANFDNAIELLSGNALLAKTA